MLSAGLLVVITYDLLDLDLAAVAIAYTVWPWRLVSHAFLKVRITVDGFLPVAEASLADGLGRKVGIRMRLSLLVIAATILVLLGGVARGSLAV